MALTSDVDVGLMDPDRDTRLVQVSHLARLAWAVAIGAMVTRPGRHGVADHDSAAMWPGAFVQTG